MKKYKLLGLLAVLAVLGAVLFGAPLIVGPNPAGRTGNSSEPGEKKDGGLESALSEGMEWFPRNADGDFLHYSYNPAEGGYVKEDNSVRKLATLWAISESANWADDFRLKASLKNLSAIGFAKFNRSIVVVSGLNFSYLPLPEWEPEAKIAHSAFMILALLEMDDFSGRNSTLALLGAGLLERQRWDGAFRTIFWDEGIEAGINYYPGEALLSLISLYEETGDVKYLDSVRRGFYYYRDYWRGKKEMSFTPWHMQAYYKLYRAEPKEAYKEFVFEMGDFLEGIQSENTNGAFSVPGGISTAVYLEGLEDAYALAKETGDLARARKYERAVKRGIPFLLALQYTRTEAEEKGLPESVVGGFRNSFSSPTTRVDNNQHAVRALMKHLGNFPEAE